MSKKKEQVRHLKKSFAAVIKAFEKEKDKRKRDEAFAFLTGRIAEFSGSVSKEDIQIAAEIPADGGTGHRYFEHVVPSAELVEDIRKEHLHDKN